MFHSNHKQFTTVSTHHLMQKCQCMKCQLVVVEIKLWTTNVVQTSTHHTDIYTVLSSH